MLFTLVTALDRRVCRPVVFSLFDARGRPTYCEDACNLGVPVVRFRLTPSWNLRFIPEAVRLLRMISRARPDALHASGDMGLGLLVGRLAGVPVRLMTIHDVALDRRRVDRWVRLASSRWLATRTIAVSRAVAKSATECYGVSARRVETIPNGVDDSCIAVAGAVATGAAEASMHIPKILTIARLAPEKGIDVLLEVAAELLAQDVEFELHVLGDGPSREALVEQAKALAIESVTTFHGHTADVSPYLRDADVFVLPSRSEGLPTAAIEAMAASLPVVATDVGGVPEVVEDEVTGVLVSRRGLNGSKPEPDSAAMAAAVLRLIRDPSAARKMGEAGRKRFEEQFTAEVFARRYEAVYLTGGN